MKMATTQTHTQAQTQTSLKLQHSSPLDSLVRKTSAKRVRTALQSTASHPIDDRAEDEDAIDPYGGYSTTTPSTASSYHTYRQHPPTSPLLHGHFARNSTATASVNGSHADTRESVDSRSVYQVLEYHYHDDESVYSQNDLPSPALRDSWRSGTSSRDIRSYDPDVPSNSTPSGWQNSATAPTSMETSQWPVPTVVISSPGGDSNSYLPGRVPIVRPITSNFSRPVGRSLETSQAGASRQVTTPPPLPVYSEEQKRRVLERNATRAVSQPTPQNHPRVKHVQRSASPAASPHLNTNTNQMPPRAVPLSSARPLETPYGRSTEGTSLPFIQQDHLTMDRREPKFDDTRSPSPGRQNQDYDRQPLPNSPQLQVGSSQNTKSHLPPIVLPRHPPSRSDSPVSLYSAYSYYNYDGAVPSPVSGISGSPSGISPASQPPLLQSGVPRHVEPTHLHNDQHLHSSRDKQSSPPVVSRPQLPQDFLQLGIQSHEANRLQESAMYFEKSAKENGGCGVGMLMWGLTLRHGWGCEKNEKVGFKWLRKAAENAVVDLESARGGRGVDTAPVQVSIYLETRPWSV